MNDKDRGQIIDYLTGQLSPEEREYVEAKIESDPSWHAEYERSEQLYDTIGDYGGACCGCAPADLLERTMSEISSAEMAERPAARRKPARMSPSGAPASGRSRVRPADIIVAAVVAILASVIIIPAVLHGRVGSRITACSNNLREIGSALAQFSETNEGQFPRIPTEGALAAASMYAPLLTSSGYINDPSVFLCPDSPQADWAESGIFEVPSLKQLTTLASSADQSADGDPDAARQLKTLLDRAGGSYGYNLGYVSDGVYHPTRNQGRSNFALMADQPNINNPELSSVNHGDCGQNVLFEDGHVDYLTSCKIGGGTDDIYRNDEGRVSAGIHPQDSVIGAGSQSPLLFSGITP